MSNPYDDTPMCRLCGRDPIVTTFGGVEVCASCNKKASDLRDQAIERRKSGDEFVYNPELLP